MSQSDNFTRELFEAELVASHAYQPATLRSLREGDSYHGPALQLAFSMFCSARMSLHMDRPNFHEQVIKEIASDGMGKTISGILKARIEELEAQWIARNPIPKGSEEDIHRWAALILKKKDGPWTVGNGGSFDRIGIAPISDAMLEELAHWLRIGYTPWNGMNTPLRPADRQYMYLLYYSVQGLVARIRHAERASSEGSQATSARPFNQDVLEEIKSDIYSNDHEDGWCGHDVDGEALKKIIRRVAKHLGVTDATA